jgi:hypothetical protein
MMQENYERTSGQFGMDGVDLGPNDPLPDVPDAGDDSTPITPPDPVDFSTAGITAAGSAGMSTFNDGDDQTLFERTVDVFEEEGIEPVLLGRDETAPRLRRVRIYEA